MKCPKCDYEIKTEKKEDKFFNLVINFIIFGFGMAVIIDNFINLGVEQGYKYNYDMIIMLCLTIIYTIYLIFYYCDGVKGRFILYKG